MTLTGDELYKMMTNLTLVKSEEDGWVQYYLNDETNEKWVREYPHSEYHGGGYPILRKLDSFPWEI